MNTELANRFKATAEKLGINVRRVVVLGVYLHVDSFEKYDSELRDIFGRMGAEQVITLKPGADGKHLDGGSGYRVVAKFAGKR